MGEAHAEVFSNRISQLLSKRMCPCKLIPFVYVEDSFMTKHTIWKSVFHKYKTKNFNDIKKGWS